MELPTFFARPVSLALRLYGNMYAGEMVFVLIALLTLTSGFAALGSVGGWLSIVGSVLVGLVLDGLRPVHRWPAGLHLHDAHHRLPVAGVRAPLRFVFFD